MAKESLFNRVKKVWNVFKDNDSSNINLGNGYSSSYSYSGIPYRVGYRLETEKTIASSVQNRIALDVAAIKFKHCHVDNQERFVDTIQSGLNECLTVSANKDQTGRAFLQNVVMELFDEGVVAIVPVDYSDLYNESGNQNGSFDIQSMRTGRIVQWYPNHITVEVYNDNTMNYEQLTLPKTMVAIIQNPFYAVMNNDNSTYKRLVRKMSILDYIDDSKGSNKLNLIVQLPYTVKSELKRDAAKERLNSIEDQLNNSKYGVAYIDSTEKITQLGHPIENDLPQQIEYLTNQYFSQLNITQSILDGTADEGTMLNYYNRTIEPVVSAITDEMNRKFLSYYQRHFQLEAVMTFRDPFKLVPANEIAEIADKFTRNEILTSNEMRQIIGILPSSDPNADELRNKNLNKSNEDIHKTNNQQVQKGENQNG